MPVGAKHPCIGNCGALVARGVPRCEACAAKVRSSDQQRRGTAAQRGYGHRWQVFRAAFLAKPENALCAPCKRKSPPVITPATVADHIQDHKGDPVLFWLESNIQGSCQPCHDARVDAGDFGRTA